jgi:hypothetical protein
LLMPQHPPAGLVGQLRRVLLRQTLSTWFVRSSDCRAPVKSHSARRAWRTVRASRINASISTAPGLVIARFPLPGALSRPAREGYAANLPQSRSHDRIPPASRTSEIPWRRMARNRSAARYGAGLPP